jgi:hypothetical protein
MFSYITKGTALPYQYNSLSDTAGLELLFPIVYNFAPIPVTVHAAQIKHLTTATRSFPLHAPTREFGFRAEKRGPGRHTSKKGLVRILIDSVGRYLRSLTLLSIHLPSHLHYYSLSD